MSTAIPASPDRNGGGPQPPLIWAERPAPRSHLAAVALAQTASRREPDKPLLQLALAQLLDKVGEVERAAETLSAANRRFPDFEALKAPLVSLYDRLGRIDRALAVADGIEDKAKKARVSLALLARNGRFEEAAKFEAEVASHDPFHPMLAECRIRRLRKAPEAMLALCDALLARQPADSRAIYHKAIALAQLGRDGEACELMATDRLIGDGRIEAPDGYPDAHAFRASLARELAGAPDLRPDPAGHATVDGLRTRIFPRAGDPASEALVRALRASVADYSERLEGDHPFVRARPARAVMKAWGLVFPSAGRQRVHCHPDRWTTGVFYVAAPEVRGDGGCIRIGVLPDWAGVDPPWPVLTLKPVPGRLLIFPSFVPHDTIPTGAEGQRIAVAFDVTPAD